MIFPLKKPDVYEGAVEVEHFKNVSPDGEIILVLKLGLVVLPLRHSDGVLGVVLAHDNDQSETHHPCTDGREPFGIHRGGWVVGESYR